jgi:DNA-binding NtrC family response regulator
MHTEELLTVADGPAGENGGPAPLYICRVSQGPGAGMSLALDWAKRPAYLVGQGPLCELRLLDPRASRRHLSIAPHGSLLRVTDLGSSNGTRVCGQRIMEALLSGGEVIELGDTQLRVARAPTSAPLPPADRKNFGRVLGASFEMQRLFEIAEKLSTSPLNVILEGETGTGKELVAEAIYDAGLRARGPLVVFDCGGSVGQLEVALFGREGAGALENAHGGTLVLSEVADLDIALQARLLPFLEHGTAQRVGSAETRRVDVRILCTTSRDVDREVQEGRLREDLLFRLGGARIEVPPLRRRHGDVGMLITHYWKLYGGEGEPPKVLLLKLQRHPFPGNVRELQNTVARAVSLGSDNMVELTVRAPAAQPIDVVEAALAANLPLPRARQEVVREFERRYVAKALATHGGNVTRAAAASGLTRRYFHILLSELQPAKSKQ